MFRHLDIRQQIRARHIVVAEARGEHLPGFPVVDGMLAENLPCALRHGAVQLAFDDGVIHDYAAIIDGGVGGDFGDARLRIDFDFGDMATVGESGRKTAFAHDFQRALASELTERQFHAGVSTAELAARIAHLRRLEPELFGSE